MLASLLPTSILDTYSMSMLSLECKALYIFTNFLVLRIIFLSLSLFHFQDAPEYLTRRTVEVLISLMRFQLQSFCFREIFSFIRGSLSFFFFCFIWWCTLPPFPNTCNILSLQAFWCFPNSKIIRNFRLSFL